MRRHQQIGRYGTQSQGLIDHRIGGIEPGWKATRIRHRRTLHQFIGFATHSLEYVRMLAEIMQHPRQGIGRGVFAGKQGRQAIGEHIVVGKFASVRIPGQQQHFQKASGLFVIICLGRKTLARPGDERVHLCTHLCQCVIKLMVRAAFEVAPKRERRCDPSLQRGEYLVQMLLDGVIVLLQRIGRRVVTLPSCCWKPRS